MTADEAINVAQLWREGKMIGADEDEVRDVLLDECLRLRKLTVVIQKIADLYRFDCPPRFDVGRKP